METSTIRIAIRGLNEPWDASRISIEVATDRLPAAAALLRELGLI